MWITTDCGKFLKRWECQTTLIAQLVKNPSAMQEIPIQFLVQEDLLEKG